MHTWRTISIVCLALCPGAGSADGDDAHRQLAADDQAWCRSEELWRAYAPAPDPPTEGGCPIQGVCDLPGERDLFTPSADALDMTVRLHVTVFREDDGSNPAATAAEVAFQIAQLQDGFAQYRIRFQTEWHWALDSRYRDLGSDLLLVKDMKRDYAVTPDTQLNVYVTDFAYSFGVFPWDPTALTVFGGVVVDADRFRMEHRVLIHEVGHALGVWHTHHGVTEVEPCSACYEGADGANGDTTGDFCADTPAAPPTGQCQDAPGVDACTGLPWGGTMPENYMSFSTIDGTTCWSRFSRQQAARMRCWIDDAVPTWRPCDSTLDCNENGIPDDCDILEGTGKDDNGDGLLDECATCIADLDGDGEVTIKDILLLLIQWGGCNGPCAEGCLGDLDDDCDVTVSDLLIILGSIETCG